MNSNWLAIYRNAKQLGEYIGKFIAQGQTAAEYEAITGIVLEGKYSVFHGLISCYTIRTIETSHCRVEKANHVRHAIRGGGIDGPKPIQPCFRQIRSLGADYTSSSTAASEETARRSKPALPLASRLSPTKSSSTSVKYLSEGSGLGNGTLFLVNIPSTTETRLCRLTSVPTSSGATTSLVAV